MAKRKGWDVQDSVTVEVDGKEYSGNYTISSGVVTVQSIYGSTSAPTRGEPGILTAKRLLREIVRAAKERGDA